MELNKERKLTVIPAGDIYDVKEKTFMVEGKRFRYKLETIVICGKLQTKILLIGCKTSDGYTKWTVGNKHLFFDEIVHQRAEYYKEQRRKSDAKRKQLREKVEENKRNSSMSPYEFRKEVYNQTGYVLTYNSFSPGYFYIYSNPDMIEFDDKRKRVIFTTGTYICSVQVNGEYNQNGIQKVIDKVKKHQMKPYLETMKAIEAL